MQILSTLLIFSMIFLSGCSAFRSSKSRAENEQLKTVDAIRDIGTAIEAYKLTRGSYPVSTSGHLMEIKDELVPNFLPNLPEKDGWGNHIEYYCSNPNGPYFIISLGSDKGRDVGLYKTDRFPSGIGFKTITSLKEDIIFSNGQFVRSPQRASAKLKI